MNLQITMPGHHGFIVKYVNTFLMFLHESLEVEFSPEFIIHQLLH